jgi:lysophospholipase L1-like esterase
MTGLFGDSDTDENEFKSITIDDILSHDPDIELSLGMEFAVRNFAQGNTPAAEVSSVENDGLSQVKSAVQNRDLALAIVRFGLNDVHYYLVNPTDWNIEKFREAYEDIVVYLLNNGVLPILVTIQVEEQEVYHSGIYIANSVIEELSRKYETILTINDITYDKDPDYFSKKEESEGAHLNNLGTRHISALIKDSILQYFN